jgi:hypothetical protein
MEHCICGHSYNIHCILGKTNHPKACAARATNGNYSDGCMMFKLDNLRLIEDLAKEKGLV